MLPFPTLPIVSTFDADLLGVSTTAETSVVFEPTGNQNNKSIYISPDGLNLYAGYYQYMYQYSMSTAWDLSTLSYVRSSSQESYSFGGIFFKEDGSKYFTIDNASNRRLRGYDLSTNWDISTASSDGTLNWGDSNFSPPFSSGMQGISVQGLYISPSGKEVYTVNSSGSTGYNKAYQITLSTPWDVTTGTFTTAKSTTNHSQRGIWFNPNGERMWVGMATNSSSVVQYNLTTPWDLTTASFDRQLTSIEINQGVDPAQNKLSPSSSGPVFKFDGSKMYLLMQAVSSSYDDKIFQFDI